MYNEQLKEQFIQSNYSKNISTQKNVRYLFKNTQSTEEYFKTDICKMDVHQFETLLWALNNKTVESKEADYSFLRKYYLWCVSVGACPKTMTFSTIRAEDMEFYVDEQMFKNQYLKDRKEMYKLCDDLDNDIDKAIIALIYEGVLGEKMSELIGLKKHKDENNSSYVDFDKKRICISNQDGTPRFIEKINNRTLTIIEHAIAQVTYSCKNGESRSKRGDIKLVTSDYIIRSTQSWKNTVYGKVTNMSINSKMVKFKDWLDKPNLTANNIHWSGIFECLKNSESKRELVDSDFKLVLTDYGKKHHLVAQLKKKYEKFKKML